MPAGRDTQPVRVFATFTDDLHALADWLVACGVDTAAMESTGIYWIPIYEILEARGLDVYLVNARHLKNVPGKKTDILDCQWIQQLHTYGLLHASFRPPEDICALRAIARHRDTLIRLTDPGFCRIILAARFHRARISTPHKRPSQIQLLQGARRTPSKTLNG